MHAKTHDPSAHDRLRSGRGFSLVELLAVVAIMGVLASIAMPLAELSRQRSKEAELRRALRDIRGALDAYKQLSDEGRIERPVGGSGYPRSLVELAAGVRDAKSPMGAKLYLLRRVPRDPMSPDHSLSDEDTWALRSYASPPDEPRQGEDVFDVHSRSPAKAIDGTLYATW